MVLTKFEFAQEFSVPPEFPEVLKAFAREVLRDQPENIEQYAVKYFESCVASCEAENAKQMGELSQEDLQELISSMFSEYDSDGNGYLDPKEFMALIEDFRARVNFPKDEVYRFLGEADMNSDGQIEYEEFIPLALQIVQSLYAKASLESNLEEIDAAAEKYLVHGMTREELTSICENVFKKMDIDGSGRLTKSEFITALTSMELGLTRREVNALMFEVDQDDDGSVSYDEFAPFCFDLLHKMTAMKMMENEMEDDQLCAYLQDLFQAKDVDNTGLIPVESIRGLMHQAMLGLTRIQIYSVISHAQVFDDNMVKYSEFIPKAAKLIKSMTSFEFASINNQEVNEEDIRKQLNSALEQCGTEISVAAFETAVAGSGHYNEQEIYAMVHLSLNGRSKHVAQEENFYVNLEELRPQLISIIKQLRLQSGFRRD